MPNSTQSGHASDARYHWSMPNIGPLELAIVLIIALVVFGPKRLPELGRSLGRGIREFRGSVSGEREEHEEREKDPRREIPPGDPGPAVADEKAEPVADKRR
jgi:sec-independent protein translocase protein TatA